MNNFLETMKPVIVNAGKAAVVAILEGLTQAIKNIPTEERKVVTTSTGFTVAENQTKLIYSIRYKREAY